MAQGDALSSGEIQWLRDELAAGRTPAVWFTSSAVGVTEGRSGKVTALGEVAEGDFVRVRPAGSKDVLSFSAGEITVERPPRQRKTGRTPAETSAEATSGTRTKTASTQTGSTKTRSTRTGPTQSGTTTTSSPKASSTTPQRTEQRGTSGKSASSRSGNSRQQSSNQPKRKARQISGATVTLTADENGQWTVEVNTGKKHTLRPTTVPASAVGHAAKALHDDVAAAVEPLLEAAREQQRAHVEQLQSELADAQRALDELTEYGE